MVTKVFYHMLMMLNRMAFPLVVLAFGSIFVGYLTRDMIIGVGTQFWGSSLFTLPANEFIEAEFIPHSVNSFLYV